MKLAYLSIAVGIVAMVSALWLFNQQPPESIGEVPERASELSVEPKPEPEPEYPVTIPEYTEYLPPEPEGEPEPVVESVFDEMPSSIAIPSIGVDNPIVSVGLNPDNSMEIPHDVQTIGWYEPTGVLPGDEGTAVMAGHVDSRSQGAGAFFDLRHLELEDEITLTHDGVEQTWRVTARRNYDKNEIPLEDIFIDHGEPRLVLITCGGEFDQTARSYKDNIVVYAELV